MKKHILYIVLILLSSTAFSQSLKVRKMKKINLEEKAWFPDFGNDDKEILLSGPQYQGLLIYNVRNKRIKNISEAPGAGDNIIIDESGSILFTESQFVNGKKTTFHKSFNPSSGITKETEAVSNNKIQAIGIGKKIIILKEGDEQTSFSPRGDKYYLWASLSPDQSKILFTAAGEGTYISDLSGNILSDLGYLNAPQWMNNNWVVGMNDVDDGNIVLSSDIIAVHIKSGERFNLTEKEDFIAQYPKSTKNGERLLFHSIEGDIYLLKIRFRK